MCVRVHTHTRIHTHAHTSLRAWGPCFGCGCDGTDDVSCTFASTTCFFPLQALFQSSMPGGVAAQICLLVLSVRSVQSTKCSGLLPAPVRACVAYSPGVLSRDFHDHRLCVGSGQRGWAWGSCCIHLGGRRGRVAAGTDGFGRYLGNLLVRGGGRIQDPRPGHWGPEVWGGIRRPTFWLGVLGHVTLLSQPQFSDLYFGIIHPAWQGGCEG